jgi:hypothetical protein
MQTIDEKHKETTGKRIIWRSSGLHLTDRDKNGWLVVSSDLLRAYYTRPEIHPVEESCDQENRLFERLMEEPVAPVTEAELAAIKDQDAAENYRIVLRFRDHLLKNGTLESAYMQLFLMPKSPMIPPVFIEQMVHLIMSNIMTPVHDPLMVRASELFFREQKVTTDDGQIMLADAEVVEMYSETGGFGGLGGLLAEAGTPMKQATLDVMTEDNQSGYWDRADQFNFAIDFRYTQPGPDAFARVLEKWIRHFLGIDTRIQAMQSIQDRQWSWHIGLDREATSILNDLYNGASGSTPLSDQNRIVALFRMEILNRSRVRSDMRGKAVYLALAMDHSQTVRMKPQNLLVNLPIKNLN